jgi:regulator of RNase E activity RraB
MSTFTIINFTFYSEVKSHVHDDLMLASYIGSFLAFSRGIAIVMKLFFTNRITNALGIRGSLLITPIALIVLFIPIFIFPTIGVGNNIVILVFGLLSITNDVLRSSIQTPVFLTVMQPLRVNVRLRAHNIVKGVMDPFAFFFCGVLLLTMLNVKQKVDLMFLCYVLSGLLLLSVVWIFVVDKEYVKMLLEALKNRYFSGKDSNLQDVKTLEFLAAKVESSEATEAIVILNFVKDNSSPQAVLIIQNALKHQSVEVIIEAVKAIERLKVSALIIELNQILKQSDNHKLLCETVKAVYAIDSSVDLNTYINQSNNELKAAAIIGMFRNEKSRAYAHEQVEILANSGTHENKLVILSIMLEAKDTSFTGLLLSLLTDDNEEIVLAAIKTSGHVHNTKVTKELLNKFVGNKFENEVIEALTLQGSVALDIIEETLTKGNLSLAQQNKLIAVIGRCNTNESKKILMILLQRLPLNRLVIINALYQSGFKSEIKNSKQFENYCNEYLFEAAKIMSILAVMESDNRYVLLKQALNLELVAYRNVLLNLFSFMYPSDKINQVRNAFQLNKKDGVANALEIIDVTVAKDLAQKFIAIYDTAAIHYKVLEVKKSFGAIGFTMHDWFSEVLNPETIKYNSWTKSCAVYEINETDLMAYKPLIKQLVLSSNPMVKQTAEYVLSYR